MDVFDLALGCCPPAIAMALQRWSIPTDVTLEKLATAEQERAHMPASAAKLFEYNFKGLVAENGLVTTIVSFPSGILALAHVTQNNTIYVYFVLFVGLAVIASILYVISGHSPHDFTVQRFRYHENRMPLLVRKISYFRRLSGKAFLPFARIDAIRWVVYVLNGSIVVWALCTYVGQRLF
jgi:hypothetical protein